MSASRGAAHYNPRTNGRTYSYCTTASGPPGAITPLDWAGRATFGIGSANAADNIGVVAVQFTHPTIATRHGPPASSGPVITYLPTVVSVTVNNAPPPPPPPPPPSGTKTLLYGWLNERWLAATMSRWANSGFGGFIIAGQIQWFTPASDLDTYNRQSFTDLNANGAAYGITDNFFIVSLTAQNWNDGSYLPAWNDDTGWTNWTNGGLTALANFARTTGARESFSTPKTTAHISRGRSLIQGITAHLSQR